MAKVTVLAECTDCGGTGLYTGFTCHEGATSECEKCKGTGAITISYTPFSKRKEKEGVKRVFANVRWKNVYPDVHEFDDGSVVDFSQYGCTYEEWKNGEKPIPY